MLDDLTTVQLYNSQYWCESVKLTVQLYNCISDWTTVQVYKCTTVKLTVQVYLQVAEAALDLGEGEGAGRLRAVCRQPPDQRCQCLRALDRL